MNLDEKLDKVMARHDELAQLMTESAGDAGAFARLSKEYSDLTPIVEKIRELKQARAEKADSGTCVPHRPILAHVCHKRPP